MRKLNLAVMFSLIIVSLACKKEGTVTALPDGSISVDLPTTSDVIVYDAVSIRANVTIEVELKAALTGSASADGHNITFAVDTSKIAGYRAKYGNALVLPTGNYLFYKPMVKLVAGETKSEAAQLNFGQQKTLKGLTTYVLPVVIKAVDGKSEGTATGRVIYYVINTGPPEFVDKTGWTIAAFSSQQGTAASGAVAGILDANNAGTFWLGSVSQPMPQWVAINLNKEVQITALTYYFPTNLSYPKNGGYPTSMQLETSLDGTTWTSRGIFAGNIANNPEDGTFQQTLNIGSTVRARYVRFTILACVKYAGFYDAVAISGISLKH